MLLVLLQIASLHAQLHCWQTAGYHCAAAAVLLLSLPQVQLLPLLTRHCQHCAAVWVPCQRLAAAGGGMVNLQQQQQQQHRASSQKTVSL
jgi:hypothetical protein